MRILGSIVVAALALLLIGAGVVTAAGVLYTMRAPERAAGGRRSVHMACTKSEIAANRHSITRAGFAPSLAVTGWRAFAHIWSATI
jgi:hypothetical protein